MKARTEEEKEIDEKEIEGAMTLSDFFARKALEGVGSPTDALHAIRETLKPWITPLKDEDVMFVGGEIEVPSRIKNGGEP